jgi:e3 binding domain
MFFIPPPDLPRTVIHGVHIAVVEGPKWIKNDVIPQVKEWQREYHNWQEERARRRVRQEYESGKRKQEQATRKAEELGVDLSKVEGSGPGGS